MNILVEKTLKKYLKRKVSITLGLVVAFMITGSVGYALDAYDALEQATSVTKDLTAEEYDATKGDKPYKVVLLANEKGNINVNAQNISIKNVVINETTDKGYYISGVQARSGGAIVLGNENTNVINVEVTTGGSTVDAVTGGKDIAVGLHATNNISGETGGAGKIEVNSKELNIKVSSPDSAAHGIYVYNNTVGTTEEKANIIVNSENLTIEVLDTKENQGNGITAWSEGQVIVNSKNVVINADNAINTRGNSLIKINEANSADNTVKINGDIVFEYSSSSGTTIDSDVVINLSNSNSFLNGNIIKNSDVEIPDDKSVVDGMSLGLFNGAQWTTDGDSFVNNLTMNNGIININGGSNQVVQVDSFTGTGGTINTETELAADGSLSTGSINIDLITGGSTPTFDIHFTGITADDITDKSKVTTDGVITSVTDNIVTTGRVDEGLLNGAITVDSTGKVTQEESNTLLGLKNIAAINFLSWRQEMGSLNQRMGELRDSQGNSGVWARVYGGEYELGKGFENEYQTYQVGYDKKYDYAGGKLYLGYLFSYTDGSTDYELGSGDNSSIGAGVYGTWLNNSGHYVDVVAKISRLHNEYDIYSATGVQSEGDYTNYGLSLSTEYGKRFNVNRFFIEPSVRMDLGKVSHRSYTTSSGVRVDQDSIYTAQGSLGAKVGYSLERGNIYARLSGVKEFAGDIDMSFNGKTPESLPDLEDEWLEYGIGGNYRVSEGLNVYLDLSRTTESLVDTNWQANLGFRYEF